MHVARRNTCRHGRPDGVRSSDQRLSKSLALVRRLSIHSIRTGFYSLRTIRSDEHMFCSRSPAIFSVLANVLAGRHTALLPSIHRHDQPRGNPPWISIHTVPLLTLVVSGIGHRQCIYHPDIRIRIGKHYDQLLQMWPAPDLRQSSLK